MSLRHRPIHHLHGNERVPQSFVDEAIIKVVSARANVHQGIIAKTLTGSTSSTTRPQVDEAFLTTNS
jgi:hypothetical protein